MLAIFFIGLVGFISAANMSMNRSLVQLQVKSHMRGRIMSVDMMSHGLMPLGIVPIGWIAETYSVQTGLFVSGVLLMLLTIGLGFTNASIRSIQTGYDRN